ncbi:GNAT family N-acetyltransferase [Phycicoccus sp. HDW14]|uniref:GNAT family N-acetyltransferase n=1 Tax=Phycicoccus sp. HDW14 TaxID=2714941 RepID=UPI00140A4016|nr:GNAT family N-acetyltransferase [Phycicoccus sp. HDW14]QIM21427.1 GNAT family N-acetyltransferase [Phycicoccus sp. HDW14]
MSWDDLEGTGIRTSASELDTRRFGFPVARLTVGRDTTDAQAAQHVVDDLERLAPAVTVARWPADRVGLAGELVRRGLQVLPADTLVYWAGEVADVPSGGEPGPVSLADAPALAPAVEELVAATFADYPTHYLASPDFPPDLVLAGYVEWAGRTAREHPEDVLLQLVDGVPAAVATTARVDGGRGVEVLLAGTHPDHRGRGVYRALLAGVLARAGADGAQRVVISTQASNTAVQRVWCTLGLRPVSAWTTVHLRRG